VVPDLRVQPYPVQQYDRLGIGVSPFEVMQGAVASFYPDFQEGGVVAGKMIARVLKGESPGTIPFYRLVTTKVAVNPAEAGKMGVTVPPDVVKQADTVVGGGAQPQ